MTEQKDKKARLIERMAEHLVREGLVASGLRALAKAAGTSDRMLLYYFEDKDEILTAVFDQVAKNIEQHLSPTEAAPQTEAQTYSPDILLERLWRDSQTPQMQAYLLLLLEMASAAARHGAPYREASQKIGRGFQHWIAEQLDIKDPQARDVAAYKIMANLDGLALLNAIGHAAPDQT